MNEGTECAGARTCLPIDMSAHVPGPRKQRSDATPVLTKPSYIWPRGRAVPGGRGLRYHKVFRRTLSALPVMVGACSVLWAAPGNNPHGTPGAAPRPTGPRPNPRRLPPFAPRAARPGRGGGGTAMGAGKGRWRPRDETTNFQKEWTTETRRMKGPPERPSGKGPCRQPKCLCYSFAVPEAQGCRPPLAIRPDPLVCAPANSRALARVSHGGCGGMRVSDSSLPTGRYYAMQQWWP